MLLRDVLSWRASEGAEPLGTTTAGVNSALQKAHAGLDAVDLEALSETTDGLERELVGRYVAAFADDDIDSLVSLSRAL
jgi:RNA polymerase sigma-70 factor, ECF subfamily